VTEDVITDNRHTAAVAMIVVVEVAAVVINVIVTIEVQNTLITKSYVFFLQIEYAVADKRHVAFIFMITSKKLLQLVYVYHVVLGSKLQVKLAAYHIASKW